MNIDKVKYESCPVVYCMEKIGGKWKPIIIYLISNELNRFGRLQKRIQGISKQMLTNQLRELERDGIIDRKVYPVVPPKVEYALTDLGQSLLPIIHSMQKWGREHR